MKNFTICTLILSVLLMSFSMCSFAADFSVTGNVDFDSSDLTVTIKTPATYEQNILVTVYKENDTMSVPTQYVRMGQTRADKTGEAEIVFNLSSLEKGRYTISATGGGRLAGVSHDTFSFYFETADETNNVTIPSLATSVGSELDALAARLERDYRLDMGDGYRENAEKFLDYYVAIREDDYKNSFESMAEVQEVLNGVNLIMATLRDTADSELQVFYEQKCEELSLYDSSDKDYKENSKAVYPILKVIAKDQEANIDNLTDIREIFYKAQGLATINTKNSETVTEYILKYGDELGIDLDDYNKYCKKYGEIAVNLDFIGRNFTKPEEFVKAYNDSTKALTKTTGGGGGGGGGGGSSPSKNDKVNEPLKGNGITSTDLVVAPVEPLENVSFNDVSESHWAKESISALAKYEVITGFEDGTFRPDALVTKEQFVKMVVEAFGIRSDKTNTAFTDVKEGHWAAPYIAIAVDKGIINGKSEAQFGIGENLSRQNAAVIVSRVADIAGYSLAVGTGTSFSDKGEIAAYALEGVTRLSNAGIINGMGDGTFNPNGTLTRAQVAKILYMMITNK